MERQLRYFHSQIHAYNELAPKEGKPTIALSPAPADVRHLQLDDLAVRTWSAGEKIQVASGKFLVKVPCSSNHPELAAVELSVMPRFFDTLLSLN